MSKKGTPAAAWFAGQSFGHRIADRHATQPSPSERDFVGDATGPAPPPQTAKALRLGEVLEHVQDAYGAAESASELLWAVARVLDDACAHEVDGGKLDAAVILDNTVDDVRHAAAARAVAEVVEQHAPAAEAYAIAARFNDSASDAVGLSLNQLANTALHVLVEWSDGGTEVRAITQCAAAMARAWREVR